MASSQTTATFAVVVLNWNGAADTLECLESLRHSQVRLHLIVVDNHSSDDSVRQIREAELADTILESGANIGYAAGNNLGIRQAIAREFRFIAVLNNDTVVTPETFSVLAKYLEEYESMAVSPDIRYYDDCERSWFAGGVIDHGWPRHLEGWERPQNGGLQPTECLSGCCIAASRQTWERTGLFDPAYFLIFEDSDWSVRAREGGVRLCVAADGLIMHKVSRSFAAGPSSLLGSFYFARNGLIFQTRHAKRFMLRFVIQWLVRPSASSLIRRAGRREVAFRWLGGFAFVLRLHGRAPRLVERLAARIGRL